MSKLNHEAPVQESQVSRNIRTAQREGEERRRQYLATLDPREREPLAMGDPA